MQRWMPSLFAAICVNDYRQIYRAFENLTLDETVEAVSFAGPDRARLALQFKPVGVSIFNTTAAQASLQMSTATVNVDKVCEELLSHWQIPGSRAMSTRYSQDIQSAITRVGQQRAATARVTIDRDLSAYLPNPNPGAPVLSRADIIAAATSLQAMPAAVHAVAEVESRGDGFDALGRPKILFEAHWFQSFSGNKFDTTHPHLSRRYARTPAFRAYYRWDQWSRMYEALLLDPSAALRSASWGKFQVMGFNHNGWANEFSFANDSFASEANHLRAFLAYVSDNGLTAALRRNDFRAFAQG